MSDVPPVGPTVIPPIGASEPPAPGAPRRRGRILPTVLAALTVLALGAAAVLWWQAGQADDAAVAARRQRHRAVVARTALDRRAETVSHAADEPIGAANEVIVSVTKILGASGSVIEGANTAEDALGRAVDLANAGDLGAAQRVYGGEVADAVAAVRRVLDDARATLATAQLSVAALSEPGG